jgi:hypothetical protein
MNDRATDELCKYLSQVIDILQPYALINKQNATTAIRLTAVYRSWADRALHRLP